MRKQAAHVSPTGVLPSTPGLSHALRLHKRFLTRRPAGRPIKHTPTTPAMQPLPGITHNWFGLIRFRSPLLTESRLFSLPAGTEMFHFPAFPPHTLYIQVRVTAHDDCRVSPFGHPRITARLTAPRGLSRPPTSFIGSWCLGIHRAPLLTWPQMLASIVQFSNNNQPPDHQRTHQTEASTLRGMSAGQDRQHPRQQPGPTRQRRTGPGPFPQDPTTCPATREPPKRRSMLTKSRTRHRQTIRPPNNQRSTHERSGTRHSPVNRTLTTHPEGPAVEVLLRKEVIQPHLPVRLPCYDFVPIAGPTFDGSPHKGWATGFGCYRLS